MNQCTKPIQNITILENEHFGRVPKVISYFGGNQLYFRRLYIVTKNILQRQLKAVEKNI